MRYNKPACSRKNIRIKANAIIKGTSTNIGLSPNMYPTKPISDAIIEQFSAEKMAV